MVNDYQLSCILHVSHVGSQIARNNYEYDNILFKNVIQVYAHMPTPEYELKTLSDGHTN